MYMYVQLESKLRRANHMTSIEAGHQCYLSLPFKWLSKCYRLLSSQQLAMLAIHATTHSFAIGWPPMLPLTLLSLALHAGHQCYLSLPSHRLSMLIPKLLLTLLPSAINGATKSFLSLPSHRLALLATNATFHSHSSDYQCWLPRHSPTEENDV